MKRPVPKIEGEDAEALARHAVADQSVEVEHPDIDGFLGRFLIEPDLEVREEQAFLVKVWAHGIELWYAAKAEKLSSPVLWKAAIEWATFSALMHSIAMCALVDYEGRKIEEEERTFPMGRIPVALFGMAVGVALCALLRCAGF